MSSEIKSNEQNKEQDEINSFIALHSKELDVRRKEIENNSRDLDNQKEISLAALNAQVQDRRENRQTYTIESTKTKWFFVAVLTIVCVFLFGLVGLNQSGLVEKIIETAFTGGLGAFGGYGIARWQMRDYAPRKNNED